MPAERRALYYVIFTAVCMFGVTFLTWYDIARLESDENYLDVIANTILVIGPV